jgi:hypothetical protein
MVRRHDGVADFQRTPQQCLGLTLVDAKYIEVAGPLPIVEVAFHGPDSCNVAWTESIAQNR